MGVGVHFVERSGGGQGPPIGDRGNPINVSNIRKRANKELLSPRMHVAIDTCTRVYGCETWLLRNSDIKRIETFEMKCYGKILRIPWITHRTNNKLTLFNVSLAVQFCKTQKNLKYLDPVTRHIGWL